MSATAADGGGVVVRGVHKRFAEVVALDDVSLAIDSGEFVTLLGPSGCGKTTLLRILAGLEVADRGEVRLDGRIIDGLPAHQRPINTVFQNYALFPHLDVFDNVAFGLRSRRRPESDVRSRVTDALALVRLEGLATRFTDRLSGGQRQRVALARALVNEPRLLLLDEPMSALDAKLRAEVQLELRRVQRQLGTTFLLVTHDQDEALTVSDRIFVMDRGHVEQSGTPTDVYERPRNRFVAQFLGAANLISATHHRDAEVDTSIGPLRLETPPGWRSGTLSIRPERIRLAEDSSMPNSISVTIEDAVFRGDHIDLLLQPGPLRARIAPPIQVSPGARVAITLPPEYLRALDD